MKRIFLALIAAVIGRGVGLHNTTLAGNTNVGLVILESGVVFTGNTSIFFVHTGTTSTGTNTTGGANTGAIFTGNNTGWGGIGGGNVVDSPVSIIKINPPMTPLLPLPPLVTIGTIEPPVSTGQEISDVQGAAPIITEPVTYHPEIQGAYDFAKTHGLTTMPSIQEARMFDAITRAEFSKMIVVMGTNVQKRDIPDFRRCLPGSYLDVPATNWEAPYVSQVCNMGVMGRLNDKTAPIQYFRPDDYITRAEMGTVLSRYLYGGQYNGDPTESYYEGHLRALQESGIMNKIDEPSKNEFRGYVMLMLQRIAQ